MDRAELAIRRARLPTLHLGGGTAETPPDQEQEKPRRNPGRRNVDLRDAVDESSGTT
jgi:hypothetical protein